MPTHHGAPKSFLLNYSLPLSIVRQEGKWTLKNVWFVKVISRKMK